MFNYTNLTDRYNARGTDTETIRYLSRQLGYPLEDILRAVQEVGTDEEEIEEYIRDRYNRS